MALSVFTPDNALQTQNIVFYIYTDPGIGKSTLAHTARRPVIFDFDIGQHRVAAHLRHGNIVRFDSWNDIENLPDTFYNDYDTIVADTVQAMLNAARLHLSKISGNTQRDGALTLKAQGLANSLFSRLVDKWRNLGKDIVFIAHAVEDEAGKDKLKIVRPDLDGKNRALVYRLADVMGYMHGQNDDNGQMVRDIYFNPAATHHAKNSGHLGKIAINNNKEEFCTGVVPVPDMEKTPTFLADLIEQAKNYINTLTPAQAQLIKAKQDADLFILDCEAANHAGEINTLFNQLSEDQNHVYFAAMRKSFVDNTRRLGLVINEDKTRFYKPAEQVAQPINEQQAAEILEYLDLAGWNADGLCLHLGINIIAEIQVQDFENIKAMINAIATGNTEIPG